VQTDNFALLGGNILAALFALLAGTALVLTVHELVHGLFFYIYSRERVSYGLSLTYAYACNPHYHFGRNSFMVIGLAPAVLVNGALIAALSMTSGLTFMVLYQIFVMHFAGCIGDFYVCGLLMARYPADTLIRDTGTGMEFYMPHS